MRNTTIDGEDFKIGPPKAPNQILFEDHNISSKAMQFVKSTFGPLIWSHSWIKSCNHSCRVETIHHELKYWGFKRPLWPYPLNKSDTKFRRQKYKLEKLLYNKSWSILWIHTLWGSIKYFLDDAFSIIIFKSLDERSHKNFTYESCSQSYNFNLELWEKKKHICFRCSFVIVSQKDMMHSFEKRKTKPSHCHHWYGKIKQA